MKNIADRALRVAIAIVAISVVEIIVGAAIPALRAYASYTLSFSILVGVVTALISIARIAESIDDIQKSNHVGADGDKASEKNQEKPQYVCMRCGADVESLVKCPKCGSESKILKHMYKNNDE